MKKKYKDFHRTIMIKMSLCLLVLLAGVFVSCSDEELSDQSIFPTTPETNPDAFEQWLLENFTYPYNVEVLYRLKDTEIDHAYTLTPADSAKCAKLAIIVKYLWFDAYAEIAGSNFVKMNVPRVLQFIGSLAIENNGTTIMGTAEGGYKITLYNVNSLGGSVPLNDYDALNAWYFTTMHHEFMHILNQKKPYDTSFNLISEGMYVGQDYYLYDTQTMALPKGFIRNYAMREPNEDYAELYAQYMTNDDATWAAKMYYAGDEGKSIIEQKLQHIRRYMSDSWNIDLEEMRSCVLRRASEYAKLDFEHLN